MLDYLKESDLVICPINIKEKILLEITKRKELINTKFMTKTEFIKNYFVTYDELAIYYLVNKYNLKYENAIEYLDNIYFKNDFEGLDKYLIYNKNFKNNIHNIIVLGYTNLDDYIMQELNKYNVKFISNEDKDYSPLVYGFQSDEEQILFVITDIIKNNRDLNNVYLVNIDEEDKFNIRKLFKLYNLPINIDNKKSIYATKTTKLFLSTLKETKDLKKALDAIKQNDIYNKIIDILNKYAFVDVIDDTFINILDAELKRAYITIPKMDNAVNLANLDDIIDDGFYYIMNFNQGKIPKIYHDDELIKDKEKEALGINTSLQKLKNEKNKVKNIIRNYQNIIITYKLKDSFNTYYPSSLIEEFNLETIMNPLITYNYSNKYNKLLLSQNLDNYINYNEKGNLLEALLSTYPKLPYKSYDNSFDGISFPELNKKLDNKLTLSYTNMDIFYKCKFRFYISYILKLEDYEDTFTSFIGNIFHYCLSHMYDNDFNLEERYKEYLRRRSLTNKEQFFIEKLYKNLEFVIKTIKYQESLSEFNKYLTEQIFEIDKSNKLKITFKGFVDKIKYMECDDKILIAIIDYKTGSVATTLDNICYGLHMQLPVYIYLTKKGIHKKVDIAGFYIQKILNSNKLDAENNEFDLQKKLKLDGYSISNEEILNKFDSSYEKSEVIKGLSLTKNGFSSYAKLVNDIDIDNIVNLVDDKINCAINDIENGDFTINPKRLDNNLIGCEYCKFRDLCFYKEEDIVNMKSKKYEDMF
jgi:ATP-dependent helicase/DNAse subunit B